MFIYAEAYNFIFKPLLGMDLGKMTLSQLLSLPYGIVVLLVVIIGLLTFFILGKTEGAMYKKGLD